MSLKGFLIALFLLGVLALIGEGLMEIGRTLLGIDKPKKKMNKPEK